MSTVISLIIILSKVALIEVIIDIFQIFSLHKVLMDLQNKQLKELNEWLTKTEERTKKMEKEPLGPDLEALKHQIQQHKVGMFYGICFLLENKLCVCITYTHTYTRRGLKIEKN